MGTALHHLLLNHVHFVLAGLSVSPGQPTPINPNAEGFVSEFLLAAYVIFLIAGTVVVFFALRGRREKGRAFAPPFPGRYPSTKEALRERREQNRQKDQRN